jgi:hypothetical protein
LFSFFNQKSKMVASARQVFFTWDDMGKWKKLFFSEILLNPTLYMNNHLMVPCHILNPKMFCIETGGFIVVQQNVSNFSATSWRGQITFQWDENTLYQNNMLSWIFITHWNNSLQVDMLLHSDIIPVSSQMVYVLAPWCCMISSKYQFYSIWFAPTEAWIHNLPLLRWAC